MRLRTFLVRRAIHTVITLLVVLVLLFVIFRLMPGDPTRLFIRPGQTEADRQDLLVELGFSHREPAPGHGYRGAFETPYEGTYEVSLTVNDTLGRSQAFYVPYPKVVPPIGNETFVGVGASAADGGPIPEIHPNDAVLIFGRLFHGPADTYTAAVNVTRAGQVEYANVTTSFGLPPQVVWNWTPTQVGSYSVSVTFRGAVSGPFVGYGGVPVNAASPSPIHLVSSEWQLRTFATSERFDHAWVVVNATSEGAAIASVSAVVRPPRGGAQPSLPLFHPLVTVPNNILEEFWTYMGQMLQGNFGKSLYTRQDVWYEISTRAGPTLLLFGSAVVISYILGILVGAVLAWRRGSKTELSAIIVSLFFYSMPIFWFGLILLWAFAFTIKVGNPPSGLFPLGGFADKTAADAGGLAYVGNVLWHMALPLLNLVILGLAGHVLLMRNSMLEVMGEDYITTAKAKGLSDRRIMYRHAARNALLPVVTAFALSISGVISGGVLTETIFSWPGMGAFLVTSTLNQDFPSVQGAFFLLAILTIVANLVADLLYPRVRL